MSFDPTVNRASPQTTPENLIVTETRTRFFGTVKHIKIDYNDKLNDHMKSPFMRFWIKAKNAIGDLFIRPWQVQSTYYGDEGLQHILKNKNKPRAVFIEYDKSIDQERFHAIESIITQSVRKRPDATAGDL